MAQLYRDEVAVVAKLRINRTENGSGEEKIQVFDGSKMVFEHIGDGGEDAAWKFIFANYDVIESVSLMTWPLTYAG